MDEIQNLLSVKGIKALQASTLYGSGLVDMLVSAPPKLSVSTIVKCLKGTSAFRLFRMHPELKAYYWKKEDRHLWSPSYFVESIGASNEQAVAKYIDDQRKKERMHDKD